MFKKFKTPAIALLGCSLALATTASYAAIDVTEVVTDIKSNVTPIGLVGSAVLIIAGSIYGIRALRSATK